MRALRLSAKNSTALSSMRVEIVPSYEGIATLQYIPIYKGLKRVEIVPSYEGIATFPMFSSYLPPLVEIVPSYEGIATQRCLPSGILRATAVEIVPSYEGIATFLTLLFNNRRKG